MALLLLTTPRRHGTAKKAPLSRLSRTLETLSSDLPGRGRTRMDHGPDTTALVWRSFEPSAGHSREAMGIPEHHCLLQCYTRLLPLGLYAARETPRVIPERPEVVHVIADQYDNAECNGTAEFIGSQAHTGEPEKTAQSGNLTKLTSR